MTRKITYKHTSDKGKIEEYAQIARSSRLFVPKLGWRMNVECQLLERIRKIVLAYDGTRAVGCCLGLTMKRVNVIIFVKKSYRRRGIGTRLIRMCCDNKFKGSWYGDYFL